MGTTGKRVCLWVISVVLAGVGWAQQAEVTVYPAWPFDAAEARRRQAETAQFLKLPTEEAIDLGAAGRMSLVLVPAGEFLMGSTLDSAAMTARWPGAKTAADRDDLPRHRVRLGKPFYLGQTEVTRAQFAAFVAETSHKTDAEKLGQAYGLKNNKWDLYEGLAWRTPGFPQTDGHPVVCVSWNDAKAFCDWLTKKAGKPFSLPTEAQWEYACRAGSDGIWPWGDREEDTQGKANVPGEDEGWEACFKGVKDGYRLVTAPVGSFEANAFGLRDMIGNAGEWCADWYGPTYYAGSPASDPPGPGEGKKRVARGGSWGTFPWRTASSSRFAVPPFLSQTHGGFRVARSLERELERKIEIISAAIDPGSRVPAGSSVGSKLDYRAKGLPPAAGVGFTERVTWEAERKAADGTSTWEKVGEAKHDRELKSPEGTASASAADPLGKLEPGSYRVRYSIEAPGFPPALREVPFTVEPPERKIEIVSAAIDPGSRVPAGTSVSSKLTYRASGLPAEPAVPFTERATVEAQVKAPDGSLTWKQVQRREGKPTRPLQSPQGTASADLNDPLGTFCPGSYRVRYSIEAPGFPPATREVPFTVEAPVVKDVKFAQEADLIGRYRFTDPTRTFDQYHGDAVLKANGEGLFREYINGVTPPDPDLNAEQYHPVRWGYDQQTRRFVWDATLNGRLPAHGHFEGNITGNTNDFTLDGKWNTGMPGRVRFERVP